MKSGEILNSWEHDYRIEKRVLDGAAKTRVKPIDNGPLHTAAPKRGLRQVRISSAGLFDVSPPTENLSFRNNGADICQSLVSSRE